MQQFTGYEYLLIDIANHIGMDKELWDTRIQWTKDHMDKLEDLVPKDPKTKFLYIKAVHALRNIDKPTGFIMSLDSTSSGTQIMAVLGKCRKSALTCNLINTGKREDIYTAINDQIKGVNITRDQIKSCMIPMMYGSSTAPKKLFGEGTKELKAFLQAVETAVPILGEMKAATKYCWNVNKKYHQFTLPDGHVVRLPTLVDYSTRLEIGKTSFTYNWKDIGVSEDGTSLLANVVHAVDGFVAREMVRRCKFEMIHIHDAYFTHPNNMNEVRETYKNILIEIAKSNLLCDILSQISGEKIAIKFDNPDLYKEMEEAEYMLS